MEGSEDKDNPIGLAEFLSQLVEAKGHLLNSQREFLLAMRSVLDVLLKMSKGREFDALEDGGASVLLILRTMIDYLLSKVPDSEGASTKSRLDALASVMEVLDSEEKRLSAFAEDELTAAKLEAICSIRKVIGHEIKRTRAQAQKESSPRIRKVAVD